DVLLREFGGTDVDYTVSVSESPWALMHFSVHIAGGATAQDVDTSDENRLRIQALLTEAARTWSDRLSDASHSGSIGQREAEYYGAALPEDYKQAVVPVAAVDDISIIEQLHDGSVKLVLSQGGGDGVAQLTWFLGGRSATLSHLLPMLQSMGVIVLEERPFTVTRPDGLPVWI